MKRIVVILIGVSWVLTTKSWSDEAKRASPRADGALIRSARSGPWSESKTWENGRVPDAGARVQVRTGHTVSDAAAGIRSRWR